MKTTPEQRAGIKQCQNGVWHDENCERCISEDRHEIEKDELRAELAATRKQLVEAQAGNAAMHSAAHRLALEAECFYMDCKDMALVSKWDDPLQTAISDVQAIRWSGDTKALDSAIAEAAEPYKALATDWLEFAKDVRPGCAAGSDWLSMLRERTIALAAKEAL